MRNMLKKATGLILSAALTFSLAAPAAAGGSSSAAGGLVPVTTDTLYDLASNTRCPASSTAFSG